MGVLSFPRFKLTDVSASLRTLADQIDSGERHTRRAIVVMETEAGDSDYCAIGEDFSRYHAIGMLVACQNDIAGVSSDERRG